jgi:MYXO-CTERM domain-containing protein
MTSIRFSSVVAFVSFAAIAAPAIADISVTTSATRIATAGGLSDNYSRASVTIGAGGQILSATRPNGQTNWPQQFGSWQITTPQGPGPGLTGAEIDTWMDSNSRGTFSCTWSTSGGTYPGTYQTSGDFAPYYVAPTARTYLELTQSSITQFNEICAYGLTGTFTFTTTQSIGQAGFAGARLFMAGSTGAVFGPDVYSGNSFTVNIQSALSTNSILQISGTTSGVAFQASTNYPFPETAYYNSSSTTQYQSAPVPAPGALALLALAGAAGSRRRRG